MAVFTIVCLYAFASAAALGLQKDNAQRSDDENPEATTVRRMPKPASTVEKGKSGQWPAAVPYGSAPYGYAPLPPAAQMPPMTYPMPPAAQMPPMTYPMPPAAQMPPVTYPMPPAAQMPPMTYPMPPMAAPMPPMAAPMPPRAAPMPPAGFPIPPMAAPMPQVRPVAAPMTPRTIPARHTTTLHRFMSFLGHLLLLALYIAAIAGIFIVGWRLSQRMKSKNIDIKVAFKQEWQQCSRRGSGASSSNM